MRPAVSAIIILIVLISCGNKDSSSSSFDNHTFSVGKDTIIEGVEMVQVPSGPYKSGLNCETRNIDYNYWIGKYEITNQQFYFFLSEALKDRSVVLTDSGLFCHFDGNSSIPEGDYLVKILDNRIFVKNDSIVLNPAFSNHPVISVSWFGASAFCRKYGFNLPSEGEWEKAARGNAKNRFPWGNVIDSTLANYIGSNDPYEPGTTPVGFYSGMTQNGFKTSDAKSRYGCYDMSGNAWEWTRDPFSDKSQYCLGKGGGFNFHQPAFLQIYYVSTFSVEEDKPPLDATHLSDGFRVVFQQ
jgi:formylglycine-generating enzyme required for sulfatase activity